MNPAVIAEGNTVHMFYRAVRKEVMRCYNICSASL